jgi:response regulator RpfG family c-di-GMP phosphodiesterase
MAEPMLPPTPPARAARVGSVLLVDDEELILKSLQRCLRPTGLAVRAALSGPAGLELLGQHPADVIISDMRMPHMSGAEFLAQVAQRWPDSTRILLTGFADAESTMAAINQGGVSAYLTKPWDDERLRAVVREGVDRAHLRAENQRLQQLTARQNAELLALNHELEQRVAQRTADLQGVTDALFEQMDEIRRGHDKMVALVSAVTALRDPAGREVANLRAPLAVATARALGMAGDDLTAVEDAARLLTVGQLGLPDDLLAKPRSQLKDGERRRFEHHPLLADAALHGIADLALAARFIHAQHEHMDGTGFPDRLAGDAVPLGARVLCVVRDYFDLVRGAVSGKVMADTEARDFILRRAGSWYDRDVVKAFALELERHNSRELSQLEVRLPVERLRAGMQLARDLVTTDGAMLLSRAQPITETLVQRILALVDRTGVQLVLYVTRASLPGVEGAPAGAADDATKAPS